MERLEFADRLIELVTGTGGNDRVSLGEQLQRVFLGGGADVVKVLSEGASTPASADRIYGFGADDKLDLSALLGAGTQVIKDSGVLGAVGDNQLRMLTVFDAASNTTKLVIRYDKNLQAGKLQASNDIQIDFEGDLTTQLVPASLTFTGP